MIGIDLNKIPFSELIVMTMADNISLASKRAIEMELRYRLRKYGFYDDVIENIIEFEKTTYIDRDEDLIFRSNDPTAVIELYLDYLLNDEVDQTMFSELIIVRSLARFIDVSLEKLKNNYGAVAEALKNQLHKISSYEFEDVYSYVYDCDPYYARHKSKIDEFIADETDLLNVRVNSMLEKLNEMDSFPIDDWNLNEEETYEYSSLKNSSNGKMNNINGPCKILKFPKK